MIDTKQLTKNMLESDMRRPWQRACFAFLDRGWILSVQMKVLTRLLPKSVTRAWNKLGTGKTKT